MVSFTDCNGMFLVSSRQARVGASYLCTTSVFDNGVIGELLGSLPDK